MFLQVASFEKVLHGPEKLPPPVNDWAVDIVSATIAQDFPTLLKNFAIESWIRHIKNIRSITFISPQKDYEALKAALDDRPTLPPDLPIRFFDERYFLNVYGPISHLSYEKMTQQMFKLHVFDMPWLLPNVAIVDSDTVWSRDHTFVYPNGSAV